MFIPSCLQTLPLTWRTQLVGALVLSVGLQFSAHAHDNTHPTHARTPARAEQMDWGIAGQAKSVQRTVEVRMDDTMRFAPNRLDVRQGETVRIRVINQGKALHEFVMGTAAENAKHAELMLKFPNMQHDAPYMAHVAPGQSEELIWTFNRAGQFEFACLIAGHYQAGMVGVIQVAAANARDMTDGEVRRISKDTGKITLKHGEIKHLDMPGMTMVFQVKDPRLLDTVKVGDKVRFRAEQSGSVYWVTDLEVVKTP